MKNPKIRLTRSRNNAPPAHDSLPLMHGGPLSHLMERLHLSGCTWHHLERRALFWVALVWIPPFMLAGVGSHSDPQAPHVNIFNDFTFHVRCLVAIPILIVTECLIHSGISDVLPTISARGLIREDTQPVFRSLLSRIRSLRDSAAMEAFLLLLSLGVVASRLPLDLPSNVTSWKNMDSTAYVLASGWNKWVGMTTYYFFVLRWAWRFLLWSYFLLKIAHLKPNLKALHADQMGGIGFLMVRNFIFSLAFLAISSVISANIAAAVIYGGVEVDSYLGSIGIYLALIEGLFLLPLLAFTPLLFQSKKEGLKIFGNFANQYAEQFNHKWLTSFSKEAADSLGTPDLQSLNDLNGSYDHLKGMSIVLISRGALIGLAIFIMAPLFPLVLLKIPFFEILEKIARIVA